MRTAYITHPDCLRHEMGAYHPESPHRLNAIEDRLVAQGVMDLLRYRQAPAVTREQLLRVHDASYIDSIEAQAPDAGLIHLDPDTAMNPYSLSAARHAAGASVLAVDLVLGGEMETAFCAVRPPGHHAERDRAMGFCLFNNVAVGAAHALEAHGLERVAICDFDVHHGNGTENIFSGDERVLFCSSFQHPFYPFTGTEDSAPNVIHVPLRAGTDSAGFREAVERHWLPALEHFRPQLILISAGFDGHLEDDMGGLSLLDEDYAWVTARITEVAERHAERRVVSTLEGGYVLDPLARSAVAHIKALMGI